jgi:thioredoxin reductase
MTSSSLPIAVIGAGPVGLAAAAHLIERGRSVRLYEAGPHAGASVAAWGHVRLFTPWRFLIDNAAARLLARRGWSAPAPDEIPTGRELVERYLAPLAATPEIAAILRVETRALHVAREGGKLSDAGRETRVFALHLVDAAGARSVERARAVIDASGTWTTPNPLGADGVAAAGEAEAAAAGVLSYGPPDALGTDRARFAGRATLVVGAGHSAASAILDLATLAAQEPGTRLVWATRGGDLSRLMGGGAADALPERGRIGARIAQTLARNAVEHVAGFALRRLRQTSEGWSALGATAQGETWIGPFDRIVCATGQRPDLAMLTELRLDLHPALEAPRALGPMIDPNLHSCGTVPPHGRRELSHPEPNFYVIGAKSYGRAPTFLMLTGYEQARSVVAALSGDLAAADDVRLVLPQTGACSGAPTEGSGCCGGPAPSADSCCMRDVEAKSAGKDGCGCGAAA